MDETKLVIYHGGSWIGNCYEGGMTKWVNVPRCVSYEGLVKLVEDVVKVDVARYNLQLWSLAFTISGTARPRIENDNDVSCMMNVDKLLPEVFVSVSAKETIDCVQDDNLCDLPTSQLVYVRGSHDDEYWHDGVGYGSGSVGGHGCAGPSGFATFNGVSFREDGLGDDVDQTSEHASPRAWVIPAAERNIDSEKYTVCPVDSVNFNVKDENKDGMRRNLYQIIVGIATKPQVGLKHMQGKVSLLGILVIGILLAMCDQGLFFSLFFVRKLEDQERSDLNLSENMVMERPEIVRFVKNRVTTDRFAGMHSLVRLLHHAHPHQMQHSQHRSDHIDLTDAGSVEMKVTIHKSVH
ncbi:hypothetical protein Ddye_014032 [Dipteronia dyeriana]|uniref:Uncharacterized protein n=1 Tax=Dipteronia dyeriana TaxID=168575 RepID=A0AAE0CK84_9ROSI|nr:hypothetical protein Ddye_014032 [Dipteronia dyeriana]